MPQRGYLFVEKTKLNCRCPGGATPQRAYWTFIFENIKVINQTTPFFPPKTT